MFYVKHTWNDLVSFIAYYLNKLLLLSLLLLLLLLLLYKLWSKTLLHAIQPYKLPILTSQLHPAQRATPKNGVTPLPYV